MAGIAVVTDSSANLPDSLVREYGIQVVPVLLTYEGLCFRDGVDITAGQVYQWQRADKRLPTTAAPSVGDFLRVYAKAAQEASGLVSIHLPPQLSAVYNTALVAAQLVDPVPIRVINCNTVAMGQGFVVLEAARAAAGGAGLEEVVARANAVAAQVKLLAVIDTLTYLHHGGRIGGAAALMGTALQVKPIVHVVDGRVEVFAKPRTKSKAVRMMLQYMAEQVGDRPVHAAIFHADVKDEAEALRRTVAEQFACAELYVTDFTPVMGAHTGPGLLGIVFYTDPAG